MKRFAQFVSAVVVLLLIAGSLAACGDDDDRSPPPNVVITIQPQPEATIVEGCPTADLESWYEVAGSLIETFSREARGALGLEPQQMPQVLNRLSELRNKIARQPTPECAITAHSEILLTVREVLNSFQRYTNEEITQDELRQQVESATIHIDTEIAALLEATQAGLEEELRKERDAARQTPGN